MTLPTSTIAVIGAAVLAVLVGTAPGHAAPFGAKPLLGDLWQRYASRFVTRAGRVVDNANGDVSTSESQGYGMLLAERVGDRARFRRIWRWTRNHLFVRDDGLAAWRWDPNAAPHIADTNNATDGDLLVAWALSAAGARWHAPEYDEAAKRVAAALARTVVAPSRWGPILLPAAEGFGRKDQVDGPIVNLSYWIFPALAALRHVSDATDWAAISGVGEKLLGASRFGPRGLPTNWISLAGTAPAPARKFRPVYGYDAVRIPLYLAWAGSAGREALDGLPVFPLSVVEVDSGRFREPLSDPDYRAIPALVACVKSGSGRDLRRLEFAGEYYYPASLHLLALAAALDAGCLR